MELAVDFSLAVEYRKRQFQKTFYHHICNTTTKLKSLRIHNVEKFGDKDAKEMQCK